MSRRRRILLALVVTTAVACAAAFVASDVPARWLVVEDPVEAVDAAVVLAGDPDYERTTTAAGLVVAGMARLLVLTGGEPGPGDSAASLREWALRKGVPPEKIILEQVSRSTREAMLALGPLLHRENVHTIALVTSPYHQRRAWLAACKALPGIKIVNRPATPSSWAPVDWWRSARSRQIVASEYAKLAYYAVRGWL